MSKKVQQERKKRGSTKIGLGENRFEILGENQKEIQG